MKSTFDKEYWEKRYHDSSTGWDLGAPSSPLQNYIDQITDKTLKILIPGAGNAYEAEYLHQKGFSQIHVVDIARPPLEKLKERCPDFPSEHLHQANFFDFSGQFDLILEQTFFCAISPDLRPAYAKKMPQLLKSNGKLVGVLFNFPLDTDNPPFGGNKTEYLSYFEPYFEIKYFEECYNSIPPRAEREFFICLTKKKG